MPPREPPRRFPDERTSAQRRAERREIQTQIDHLKRFPEDKRRKRKILRRLASGRSARGLPPFAELPNGRIPALALRQFLVREGDLARRDVRKVIRIFRLSQEPVEDLRVVRLTPPRLLRALLFRIVAALLRKKKVPITPNYLVPQGGWSKAEGGPEHTAGVPQLGPVSDEPIQVAVIDTGLGPRTDAWLQGLESPDTDPLYTVPSALRLGLAGGHGTFVAGIVQQVQRRTHIRIYRGLDVDGIGTDDGVGAAVRRAALDGAQIINLSLGTQTIGDMPPPGMESGIQQAIDHYPGILIVCAAGNYGDSRKVWPSAFSKTFPGNVVAVAGLNPQCDVPNPEWTTHGDFVQFSTVAEGIVSTYVEGIEDPVIDNPPDEFHLNDFAIWTGTSFAAPQIVGEIASICLTTGQSPAQAVSILKSRGLKEITGYGTVVPILPGT